MELKYLDLADFLLIAASALESEPDVLAKETDLHLAESALMTPSAEFGGVEFYVDFPLKVAVLGWQLIRNRSLPEGSNRRTGFLAMIEFVERNGYSWTCPSSDGETGGDETIRMIDGVASGQVNIMTLRRWIVDRIGGPSSS